MPTSGRPRRVAGLGPKLKAGLWCRAVECRRAVKSGRTADSCFAVRRVRWIAIAALLVPTLSHGMTVEELCPGATSKIGSLSFPEAARPELKSGSAEVDFTVGVDAQITDVSVSSATDPAFEAPARALVASLTCTAQSTPIRVRLPVDFERALSDPHELCPNFREVAKMISYPRAAFEKGLWEGRVVIEFNLLPDGQIREFYVMSSTDETFAKPAAYALSKLKCKGLAKQVRVRVPFEFKVE